MFMCQLLEWCMRMRKNRGKLCWIIGTVIGTIPITYSKWILLRIHFKRKKRLKKENAGQEKQRRSR